MVNKHARWSVNPSLCVPEAKRKREGGSEGKGVGVRGSKRRKHRHKATHGKRNCHELWNWSDQSGPAQPHCKKQRSERKQQQQQQQQYHQQPQQHPLSFVISTGMCPLNSAQSTVCQLQDSLEVQTVHYRRQQNYHWTQLQHNHVAEQLQLQHDFSPLHQMNTMLQELHISRQRQQEQ